MSTIKAPFNFVPLNEKVFFPDWADQISQDIPFEDGVSGSIELKITAESPIFVRNGHAKEDSDAKNETYNSFSKTPDGQYFIPATSIKGAIRSVLEIMSFGKMKLDKNAAFAQRDWNNTELYPLRKVDMQKSIHCGWLKYDNQNQKFVVKDCGTPYRIAQSRIDEYLNVDVLESHFCKNSRFDLNTEVHVGNKTFDPKTAAYKYELLKDHQDRLLNLRFSIDGEFAVGFQKNRYCVDPNGDLEGSIVLTGQPDKWMWPRPKRLCAAGKFYEFIFPAEGRDVSFSQDSFEHFRFIYKDTPEWERMQKLLDEDGIPVFFRIQNDTIKDLGIAYLYKLPYEKTPYDLLGNSHKDDGEFDLAECIFGVVNGDVLKGRVHFGNMFSVSPKEDNEISLTLSSPKASYYPMYISQNGRSGTATRYNTYNNGKLSGWKRYPVRNGTWAKASGNEKIDTIIRPLKAGTVFNGIIRFHNLRPAELGALLSALTFHDTLKCCHQVGQAKPFGYGKISILPRLNICGSAKGQKDFMIDFEEMMQNWLDPKMGVEWCKTEQIKQLFTMSKHEMNFNNETFEYMQLNMAGQNDFEKAKGDKEYLELYTKLSGQTFAPESLYRPVVEERRKYRIDSIKTDWQKVEDGFFAEKNALDADFRDLGLSADKLNDLKVKYEKLKLSVEEKENKRTCYEKSLESIGCCDLLQQIDISDCVAKIAEIEKRIRDLGVKSVGLSDLDRVNVKGEYTITKFPQIKNNVDRYLNRTDHIPEDQYIYLHDTLLRVYKGLKEREKKEWQQFDGKLWKTIIEWTNKAIALQWFHEISGQQ